MTEEYIYERERELIDYFRNNLTDPLSRGTTGTGNFTTTNDSTTTFTLTNTLVKNVADTITVNSVTKRKGYDYSVSYGEGNGTTDVILNTAAGSGEEVVIGYHYGPSHIEREFSREDAKLPRLVFNFISADEEHAALGDNMGEGKGSYVNVTFRVEVRGRYAFETRELLSKAFNLGRKMRQSDLYRTNIVTVYDIQNFDYDQDKAAYIWQFSMDIQWEIMYE